MQWFGHWSLNVHYWLLHQLIICVLWFYFWTDHHQWLKDILYLSASSSNAFEGSLLLLSCIFMLPCLYSYSFTHITHRGYLILVGFPHLLRDHHLLCGVAWIELPFAKVLCFIIHPENCFSLWKLAESTFSPF